jgi:hypothetical protein
MIFSTRDKPIRVVANGYLNWHGHPAIFNSSADSHQPGGPSLLQKDSGRRKSPALLPGAGLLFYLPTRPQE